MFSVVKEEDGIPYAFVCTDTLTYIHTYIVQCPYISIHYHYMVLPQAFLYRTSTMQSFKSYLHHDLLNPYNAILLANSSLTITCTCNNLLFKRRFEPISNHSMSRTINETPITCCTMRLWNNLPPDVKSSVSFSQVKKVVFSIQCLKAVDTIGNYSKYLISIKPFLVTCNRERLMV